MTRIFRPTISVPCKKCFGTGLLGAVRLSAKCHACDGTGRVEIIDERRQPDEKPKAGREP